jgi:cellulose synthase/poly-beta-1,6-N-acetylglucosamine synthase-like glycosyltransferase
VKPEPIPEWILRDLPEANARTVLSAGQRRGFAVVALALVCALALAPRATSFALNVAFIVLYLAFAHYRLVLQFLSLRHPPTDQPPLAEPPDGWPHYSILVPLYREARAVPGLLSHLQRLDYPADRIEVLLLLEEDDTETRAAVEGHPLPAHFRPVLVPPSPPRTKPKACNVGLRQASGEFLVVYDAEDRPEPDQLRKAVAAFRRESAQVVCLQARLNFYNRDRNLLTRLFAIEYSTWFDFCIPGLFLLDAPIPLGGTSNHFRLDRLRALGGWDPFNVTEDCDLGIRLYAAGQRTHCLESTTWEEATFRLAPWVRQRSRWVKGYIQTYWVHLRRHRRLARELGAARLLHFHFLFGATAFCLLLNPFYWALTVLWLAGRFDWISGLYPLWLLIPAMICLLAGNAAFVLSGMLACLNRGHYGLLPACLLLPPYWVLMSVGAWRGALQLITRPHHWEKTPHEGVGDLPSHNPIP